MPTMFVVFGAAAWCVLTVAIVAGHQKNGELSGIHGVPVEGHDIAAGIEIVGTKQIDFLKIRPRLRLNGADIRLGFPIEGQTLCRFKEVLKDVMSEKGFLDASIRHQARADLWESPAPDAQVHDY